MEKRKGSIVYVAQEYIFFFVGKQVNELMVFYYLIFDNLLILVRHSASNEVRDALRHISKNYIRAHSTQSVEKPGATRSVAPDHNYLIKTDNQRSSNEPPLSYPLIHRNRTIFRTWRNPPALSR